MLRRSGATSTAYIYSAAGIGESTTDVAWDGQGFVYELGELLVESERFCRRPELAIADVDLELLTQERLRNGTFNDSAALAGHPEQRFRPRRVRARRTGRATSGFSAEVRPLPFVPNAPDQRDADCYEAFNIQVEGIAKRLSASARGGS